MHQLNISFPLVVCHQCLRFCMMMFLLLQICIDSVATGRALSVSIFLNQCSSTTALIHFNPGYAIAWSGSLVFDALIFGLTVYQALVQHQRTGSSLLGLMLRDGDSQQSFSCLIPTLITQVQYTLGEIQSGEKKTNAHQLIVLTVSWLH